jgi:hypothetical protein
MASSGVYGDRSKAVKSMERSSTFESMLKLLLFLETELQFKEELLELLMVRHL